MITDWLTTILALRWVLIVGGLMFRLRPRRGLVLLARTADGGRVVTAWEQFEAVKALSGDQYDFVTAFILSWLAGAIDESGHISAAEGTRRCGSRWGVRSRADLDLRPRPRRRHAARRRAAGPAAVAGRPQWAGGRRGALVG